MDRRRDRSPSRRPGRDPCHPSLANDNLSGLSVATELVRELVRRPRRLGVRLLLFPPRDHRLDHQAGPSTCTGCGAGGC